MKVLFKSCLLLSACTAAWVLPAQADEPAPDGKEVYQQACARCHERGIIGAPRREDANAMEVLRAKGKDTLYRSTIEGVGRMPAKGRATISDEAAKAATDYMLAP